MNNIKHEVIVSTGEILEREMTAEELAQDKLDREAAAAEAANKKAEIAAKEAARQALLDKLGITADEAKLLLG